MHWLDDAIATLKKEHARWKHSDGSKSESHGTAAAILGRIAESGATLEELKTELLREPEVASVADPVDSDAETPTA